MRAMRIVSIYERLVNRSFQYVVGASAIVFATVSMAAQQPLKPSAAASAGGTWTYAYAAFGQPKYPPDFDHFDYADPAAKKGGTLYLKNPDLRSSFDKFNPYTIKGQSPAGASIFMFEPLMLPSADEPSTMYGLVAQQVMVAPDKSSISFRLNPKARFNNGDPVTSEDIKYVFDSLSGKYAAPSYRTALAGIERAVIVDDRTIRFDLKEKTIDTVNVAAGLPVFSRKWAIGADGKSKNFDEIIDEKPITTGAYGIGLTDSGRRIDFVRRPDYWAADEPARRGFFNFDRVVYRYYKDGAVALEAFKAGEFDMLQEYSASRWDRVHVGAKWDDGRIKKERFPNGTGAALQSYQFNLRRPVFADVRVREALDLAFDFSWTNKRGQYERIYSVFSNSEFAAKDLPDAGQLKILEPFRASLPASVFGEPYSPPRTDTHPLALRENLRKARDLLAAAGFTLGPDGVLRNAQGVRLDFEYMSAQDGAARSVAAWSSNLQKLGIVMRVRQVDYALYLKRLDAFDFDMAAIKPADFTLPSAAEYTDVFGSKNADVQGSGNLRGVKNPAVDAALAAMGAAHSMQELKDACGALDRIVMHEHWQVPDLFSRSFRVSYWDHFARPKVMPLYYTVDDVNEFPSLPEWPITTWWMKPGDTRP
jgi:microcin C transport system substrate-binding protein